MFRVPTASARECTTFYQRDYREGFTTTMPEPGRLRHLLRTGFQGSEKDYTAYVDVLNALGCARGSALFDYGCSWGYGSWQLRQAGFDVTGFEISRPRCRYAREALGLNVCSDLKDVEGPFDVFFSCHVLEHVPSPRGAFELAFRLLRPGGLFVAFTPNGSAAYRRKNFANWHTSWGLVHPQLLDETYYDHEFRSSPRLFASSPYNLGALREAPIQGGTRTELALEGAELLFVARKEEHVTRWCSGGSTGSAGAISSGGVA